MASRPSWLRVIEGGRDAPAAAAPPACDLSLGAAISTEELLRRYGYRSFEGQHGYRSFQGPLGYRGFSPDPPEGA
jgi:hypothetical protein